MLSLSTAAKNAQVDAVVDLLDAGTGPGTIEVRTGSKPATVATAATGTVLVTITLGDPAFGSSAAGSAAGADPASQNAVADGTAGWFRAYDSNGTAVMDGTVGALTSVTGAAATDTLTTSSAHGLAVGQVVIMQGGIAGIAAGSYVVIAVPTSTTFKIAPYGSGTATDITSDGTAAYATAELTLSSLAITTGSPVDVTSLTVSSL